MKNDTRGKGWSLVFYGTMIIPLIVLIAALIPLITGESGPSSSAGIVRNPSAAMLKSFGATTSQFEDTTIYLHPFLRLSDVWHQGPTEFVTVQAPNNFIYDARVICTPRYAPGAVYVYKRVNRRSGATAYYAACRTKAENEVTQRNPPG